MKTKISLLTIWVLINIIYPPLIFGETVDEEVLVLFEAGTITMPDGEITASLKEINAPPEILSVLQNIDVVEISKGLPDFESKDTVKISSEGWIARLPDFSNLFVLRLPVKADRDSAIFILRGSRGQPSTFHTISAPQIDGRDNRKITEILDSGSNPE